VGAPTHTRFGAFFIGVWASQPTWLDGRGSSLGVAVAWGPTCVSHFWRSVQSRRSAEAPGFFTSETLE
jgi:hypothetical protein